MNKIDPIFNKTLKEVAKEKGLTVEQLQSFLAKVALVESGTDLDHTIKQIGGGPGRGIAQWETNQGKGSNRVVTSLWRTNNYFKNKGKKIPEFVKKALNKVKEEGTFDMTNLNKEEQMLVLLSDFRMGNGDLKDIKEGNEFEMWRNHWWQGNEEEVPKKKKLWEERNNYFKTNKDKIFNKLYDNLEQNNNNIKNETQIPFKNNTPQDYNISPNNLKGDLNSYIKNTQNNNSEVSEHIDRSKLIVNDYFNNKKALGGFLGSGNSIKSKNLNEFNTGGLHSQNRLGGIPIGIGSNGKTNTVEENETSFETKKGKFIFSNRLGLTDYINKSLKKKSTNQFPDGGNLDNPFPFLPTKNSTIGPKRPNKDLIKTKESINKKENKRDLTKLNNLFFDFSKEKEKQGRFRNPFDLVEGKDPNKYSAIDDRFSEIHKESNRSCLAGSMNCSQEFTAKNSGLPGLRTIIANSNKDPSKYKIPSRDKTGRMLGSDYIPNQSIDAWEIHDFLVGEKLGENFFTKDKNTKYDKDSYLPKGIDYKDIPLGAVIGQGNSAGIYTDSKDGERSRHALTVVGFDKKDDMPMVYDYGKLTRLDNLSALNNKSFKINRITVPNEYKGMTSNKIKKDIKEQKEKLGLLNMKPISYGSNKKHIKAIEKGVNDVAQQIAYNYEIPASTITKFSKLLPGLSNQETKINNNEGTSKSILSDNLIGNTFLKPGVKRLNNLITNAQNFFKEEGNQKQDYQLEIEAYKKYPNDPEKFKSYFKTLEQLNDQKQEKSNEEIFKDYKSSVGPFATKDITDYATNVLGIEKSDLYGVRVSNEEELLKGSQVALSYLAENYNKFKEKYKNDLSEDELIDLTLISYNNKAKTEDPEFIKYYIKSKKLKDNYLEKIKNYKIK